MRGTNRRGEALLLEQSVSSMPVMLDHVDAAMDYPWVCVVDAQQLTDVVEQHGPAGATWRQPPAALSPVRRSRLHAPIPHAAVGAADSAALAQAHVSVSRVRPSIVARTVARAASACRSPVTADCGSLPSARSCGRLTARGRPPSGGPRPVCSIFCSRRRSRAPVGASAPGELTTGGR
jgi:hypothetical protein